MRAELTREAMRNFVTVDEVADEALDDMLADVEATAVTLAPCILEDLSEHHARAAVAVMRGAVLRWVEYMAGEAVSLQSGPYSQTIASPERRRGDLLWPSEISRLQDVCRAHRGESGRQAFTLSRLQAGAVRHALICDVNFTTNAGCSCGAVLTGSGPLWGD